MQIQQVFLLTNVCLAAPFSIHLTYCISPPPSPGGRGVPAAINAGIAASQPLSGGSVCPALYTATQIKTETKSGALHSGGGGKQQSRTSGRHKLTQRIRQPLRLSAPATQRSTAVSKTHGRQLRQQAPTTPCRPTRRANPTNKQEKENDSLQQNG